MEKVSIVVFGIMGENAASVVNMCFRENMSVIHIVSVDTRTGEKITFRKAETCTLC